ncbi:MAG: TatD family hydrolase [Candidatus Kerfeldbacteria bacterium]|nr:TatD family hydrolase [Candidatus Kerfeldbacteria bacterium]
MLFDSHAHVNFEGFADDAAAVLADCQAKDVWLVNVGSQLATSRQAIMLAEHYPHGVYAAVGLHAVHVSDQPEPFRAADYAELIESSSKVVAVGETGVDYYRLPVGKEVQEVGRQREVFIQSLRLARKYDKALIMHTREHPTKPPAAYADLLEILRSEQAAGLPRGVIHCFLGTLEEAQQFIDLGFYVGITGIVTFSKKAERLQAVAKALPLEKILIETDCPYLAPEPHRGKRNIPQYVEFVARKIAQLKSLTFEQVAEQTTASARSLFHV